LVALTDIFPNNTGFAFGLNSAFLFPGLIFATIAISPFLIAMLVAACAVILVVCYSIIYNKNEKGGLHNVKAHLPRPYSKSN
jgi:hypothetical protein